jgi:hypothetical protein
MALLAVPARGIDEEQVDRLEAPRGLLGQGIRDIGDFAFVRREGIAVGAPGIVGGRAGKSDDDQDADYGDAEL